MEGAYAVLLLVRIVSIRVHKCTADFYRRIIGEALLRTP
jgi:hypothetical protein